MESEVIKSLTNDFESYAKQTENGIEFWLARDLQYMLGYTDWRNFKAVISKAQNACEGAGHKASDHFVDANKTIKTPTGASRKIDDMMLTRYACYLIVQNADPSKPIIANAQTYIAIQTRRQELSDNQRKGLQNSEKVSNYMGDAELAANLFCATQIEEKLRRENISDKEKVNKIHSEVDRKVRKTVEELGGTMPADLPTHDISAKAPESHVKPKESMAFDKKQKEGVHEGANCPLVEVLTEKELGRGIASRENHLGRLKQLSGKGGGKGK